MGLNGTGESRKLAVGSYRGNGRQTKKKAAEVAALIRVIAKGHKLTIEEISKQAEISETSLYNLLHHNNLTDCMLGRIRLWAKKIAVRKS